MNNSVKLWLEKANNDLKAAIELFNVKEPITDAICFHCQQSIEKLLKSFLIYNKKEFPKTHDLSILLQLCIDLDNSFNYLFSINIDKLTDYAIDLRYPDNFYIPTLDEAKEAIELAEKTKEFVLKKLGNEGL